jgi:molybdopterin biosynthesis enzyme
MDSKQRLSSLTPVDVVLATLLRGLEPLTPVELSLREALGCIAAELPPSKPHPPHDIAIADGWALHARDLVGASPYSPLALTGLPVWVEAGDRIPQGCDCVLDESALDQTGPIIQALAEAIPGQGVRRMGADLTDDFVVVAGFRLRPLDVMVARAVGLEKMSVRRPRVRIVNIPARTGERTTALLIEESARACGSEVVSTEARSRDAAAIAQALDPTACDLLITVGGSGVGRTDATVTALAQEGQIVAHGIALQPGRSSAVGTIGNTPVIALAGAPDQALGAWLALVLPVLDRLSLRQSRRATTLPLARKIASTVGVAEIALLARQDDIFMPLALGDFSLETLFRADAWLMLSASSEGFAAGTVVTGHMLRE